MNLKIILNKVIIKLIKKQQQKIKLSFQEEILHKKKKGKKKIKLIIRT